MFFDKSRKNNYVEEPKRNIVSFFWKERKKENRNPEEVATFQDLNDM